MRGLHWWPHGWHLWLDNGRCQAETQRNTQVHIFGRLLHKASTLPVVVWKLDRFKKWDRSRESHYVLTGSRQELWWRCMGFFFTGFTELGWCMQYLMCWYGMNAIWCPKRLHFLLLQSMCWDTLASSMLFVAELSISSGLKCFGEGAPLLS
jgi:hypothetical protein